MSGAVEGVALLPCPNPWCSSHTDNAVRLEAYAPYVKRYTGSYSRTVCAVCPIVGPAGADDEAAVIAWNTRTTPPARSYADGVEDAAKVADMFADHWLRTAEAAQPGPNRSLRTEIAESHRLNAAEIRLLSQGGKA